MERKDWPGSWRTEPSCRMYVRQRNATIRRFLRATQTHLENNDFRRADHEFRIARKLIREQFVQAAECVAKGAMYADYAFQYVVPVAARFVAVEKEIEGTC